MENQRLDADRLLKDLYAGEIDRREEVHVKLLILPRTEEDQAEGMIRVVTQAVGAETGRVYAETEGDGILLKDGESSSVTVVLPHYLQRELTVSRLLGVAPQ